jgi:hypothetical protein
MRAAAAGAMAVATGDGEEVTAALLGIPRKEKLSFQRAMALQRLMGGVVTAENQLLYFNKQGH